MIMQHIRLGTCHIFQFIERATASGQVTVTGPGGLSDVFDTLRGIRQGCPASPVIFALFISFLERRLCRLFPEAGILLGGEQKLYTNYADDMKIICKTQDELSLVYKEVTTCLAQLGLTVEGRKCKLLVIGESPTAQQCEGILDSVSPIYVNELKFLGLKIDHLGNIDRWKTEFNTAIWSLWGRLRDTGLGCYPRAMVKAYSIFLQPAVLFGIEVWGVKELLRVCT